MKQVNEELWHKAEALAKAPYDITSEYDTLPDGQTVYMARNPELPGCKAQGATLREAKANLNEARIDYIYALLVQGLPVPDPAAYQQTTSTKGDEKSVQPIPLLFRPAGDFESWVADVIQPEQGQPGISEQLRGDVVKHR